MVAFLTSLFITLGLTAVAVLVAQRRPVGASLTWGEAMAAGVYSFGVMFLAYGVVPHQFLFYADNELKWRADKIVYGPGDILAARLPFTITYTTIRDLIVTTIYIIFLGAQMALWVWWQKRGDKKPAPLEVTSTYGRPLARRT